jgi:hypothetical protein
MMIPERDISILNGLCYDENAEPNFDIIKYCLIWPDERPVDHPSKEGYELLTDLWITRGYIHQQVPYEEWLFDPPYFKERWEFGLINIPNWPGFKRVELSEANQKILAECLKEARNFS